MNVRKDEIVDLLRARGEHDKAASVGCVLPQQVDTDADASLLSRYDVSLSEILETPDGGRDAPPGAGP